MHKQMDLVLNYIKENGSITSMEAFEKLGITRLSGRVHDLKTRRGIVLGRKRIKVKNRHGESVYITKYYLDDDKEKANL